LLSNVADRPFNSDIFKKRGTDYVSAGDFLGKPAGELGHIAGGRHREQARVTGHGTDTVKGGQKKRFREADQLRQSSANHGKRRHGKSRRENWKKNASMEELRQKRKFLLCESKMVEEVPRQEMRCKSNRLASYRTRRFWRREKKDDCSCLGNRENLSNRGVSAWNKTARKQETLECDRDRWGRSRRREGGGQGKVTGLWRGSERGR